MSDVILCGDTVECMQMASFGFDENKDYGQRGDRYTVMDVNPQGTLIRVEELSKVGWLSANRFKVVVKKDRSILNKIDSNEEYKNCMDGPMTSLAYAMWGDEDIDVRDDYRIVEIASRKITLLKEMLIACKVHPELLKAVMKDF